MSWIIMKFRLFFYHLCIPIWQTCLLGRYLCCKFIRVDTFKYQISTASMWIVCRIFSVYIKWCYFLFAFDLEKGFFFFVKKSADSSTFPSFSYDAMHELHSIVISATFFQSPTSHLSGLHIHFILTQIFKLGC